MTMLSIVQNAHRELFPAATVPSVVAASTNGDVVLLYRLANIGGKALMKRFPWASLITEKTFTTTMAAAQAGSVATDFDRIIPGTMFNRTTRRRVHGPMPPEAWQEAQASLTTYADQVFRIRGSGTASILITPTPANNTDTIAYEYVSKNWAVAAPAVGGDDGTPKEAFSADDDTSRLDEHLHELDIVWRYKAEKGLDYSQELQNFERYLGTAMLNDGARDRIYLAGGTGERKPYPPQVPDTLVFT